MLTLNSPCLFIAHLSVSFYLHGATRSHWVFSSCEMAVSRTFMGVISPTVTAASGLAFLFKGAWWYHSSVAVFGLEDT